MAAVTKPLGKTAFFFKLKTNLLLMTKWIRNSTHIITTARNGVTESTNAFANILGALTVMYNTVHTTVPINVGSLSPGVLLFSRLSMLV